jgi:hypothetical protein
MTATITMIVFGTVILVSNITTYLLNSRCKTIRMCGCIDCDRDVLDQDHLQKQSKNNTQL